MRLPASLAAVTFRCTIVLILVAAETRGQSTAGTAAEEPPRQTDAAEIQDLVYLATRRPVFIRLRIRVRGEGFRHLRNRYAERLFKSLDEDSDGVLKEAEISNIPPAEQLLPPRASDDPLPTIDLDPVDADSDGIVTRKELSAYVRQASGPPFQVKLASRKLAEELDVFKVIDTNSDGTLDRREIQSAGPAILKFDANDDEILAESELSTARRFQSLVTSAPNTAAKMLTRIVAVEEATDEALNELFDRIVGQYDRPQFSSKDNGKAASPEPRLDAGELRVLPERFARWDTSGDGLLDRDEGRDLLRNPIPDLELAISLGDKFSAANSKQGQTPADTVNFSADPRHPSGYRVSIDDDRFDLLIGGNHSPPANIRDKFVDRFETADADKNDYLDTQEARRMGIVPLAFSAVDHNGDGMIRQQELLSYVELESLLFSSRVVLLLSRNAASILERVDANADAKLGLRELRQAPERILAWDTDGDGRITPEEKPESSRLILQNGETLLFRQDSQRRQPRRANQPAAGSGWFEMMDRNRDGDVSRREFLAPIETFHRLDTNADGLLSATEALD